MDARDIILRPVITEKSTNLMDDKKYTFDVLLTATKTQVRNAVEEIFDVKVKTARRRKAIVTLTNDSNDIKIFQDDNTEDNK